MPQLLPCLWCISSPNGFIFLLSDILKQWYTKNLVPNKCIFQVDNVNISDADFLPE